MMVDLKYYGVIPFSEDSPSCPELYRVFKTKDEANYGFEGMVGDAWRALGETKIEIFKILIDFEIGYKEQQRKVVGMMLPFHDDRKCIVDLIEEDIVRMGYHIERLSRSDEGIGLIPEKVAEITNLIFDTCVKDGCRIRYEGGASWLTGTDNERFVRATGRLVERSRNYEERPVPIGPPPKRHRESFAG